MAVAANLSVALSLNSARYRQGLDRARTQTNTFRDRVGRGLNGLRNNFDLLRTGIIGVAAALGAQQLLNNADELIKSADAAGFTFENYQRLQRGFELAGISQEAFARSTARVGMVLRDSERGLATAQDLLADIGLTYQDLEGFTPEEQYLAIVAGLEMVGDASRRQTLSQQLLGRAFAGVAINLDDVLKQPGMLLQ